MAYDYSDLVKNTQHWAEQALTLGWLKADEAQALMQFDNVAPEQLFSPKDMGATNEVRPLIVAFMGGTGVGKSTLLNRLADRDIAKAGVVRPTSREVTLYHHESISIKHFPAQFPLTKINIAQHDNAQRKGIVWIDMPDFDSTEKSNQALVLQWLPHIDVLIYVVSPERYKDEKAWRLLLAEGAKHAWLFALNQWDRGQLGQFIDFTQQLNKVGFVDPVIYKTACVNEGQDEFSLLEQTINALATGHVVQELEQRGMQLRKRELLNKLQGIQSVLGADTAFKQITGVWQKKWQQTTQILQKGFEWPMQYVAQYAAEHASDLVLKTANQQPALWDDWAQVRFNDVTDEFLLEIDQLNVPVAPFKAPLNALREKAPKIMQAQTELAIRLALANPGNALQRYFLKVTRFCEVVLPLLAMAWVSYKVFLGYYSTPVADNHYLGVDFAVHSSLMIALTWLIPFFILKKAQPSLKKSAFKGLKKGVSNAFVLIEQEALILVENLAQQHENQKSEFSKLMTACTELVNDNFRQTEVDTPLQRMLINNIDTHTP